MSNKIDTSLVAGLPFNLNTTGAQKRKVFTPSESGTTEIPSNLTALSKDELIALVCKLAEERSDLDRQLKRARTVSAAPPVVPLANSSTSPIKFDAIAMKKRISKKSISLVKKAAHNRAKKPRTELVECVPNEAAAMSLFESIPMTSNSSRMIKWTLTGNSAVMTWLGNTNEYIHPVKFDGKVICFGNNPPKIYAWAQYESCEAKLEKKTNTLTLKFRTFLADTGIPVDGKPPPSFSWNGF